MPPELRIPLDVEHLGLAVLPARLVHRVAEVEQRLVGRVHTGEEAVQALGRPWEVLRMLPEQHPLLVRVHVRHVVEHGVARIGQADQAGRQAGRMNWLSGWQGRKLSVTTWQRQNCS